MKNTLIILLCFIFILSFTACGASSFENSKADREKVVDLILNGDLEVAENGVVTLPDDLKDLSDSGECLVVEFNSRSAIYFFTSRGILGESRGYVYVSDRIDWKDYVNEDEYVGSEDWIEVEELEANWYSVKTE